MRVNLSEQEFSDLVSSVISEVQRKKVVRGGKIVKKVVCPDGKKNVGGKCVRMRNVEKLKRSKTAKKAAKKKKGKLGAIQRKRERSMKKMR